MTNGKKRVPLVEGLFSIPVTPGEKAHLIGSKCRTCGEVEFGSKTICGNCQGEELDEIALSNRGKLWTYTVLYYPPPLYKSPDPFVPYGVGWVELPEGIAIHSLLTESDVTKLKIGMDMESVIDKFDEDEDGNEVMIYKFKPVT